MPVDKQVLLRYQVLNDCFRNPYREYDIDDLVDACSEAMRRKLDMTAGVSKRTVQNDIANLQLPPYSIRLDETFFRGKKRLYRYTDTNYSLPMYRMNDSERHKIQDAIYVLRDFEGEPLYDWARTVLMQVEGGLLNETTKSVVSFQTNPDLKGLNLFNDLLQAILSKRVLKITYAPFGKESYQERIYPYHLKQFNDRWYLIAQAVGYDTLAHYALDRIEGFEEIQMKYKEADVDFEEYFDDVIGVTVPESEPEDIVIKVAKKRYNYIKTKPLHMSQRVVEDKNGYAIVSINVKVNNELEAMLLSFGSDVEVLSPVSFRTRIMEKIKAMNQKYNTNAENLHT
jgi:predicted DNA-binding transcriptional regulator YafY